jgi:type II secretory pathway component PulM
MRERIDDILDRIQDLLADMTPRDRMLLLGLTIALLVAIVVGSSYAMKKSLDTLETRVNERAKDVQYVYETAQEYADAQANLQVLEADLLKTSSVDLSAFLEQAAQKASIDSPDSVREKSSTTEGNLEEKQFTVTLNDISQQQLAEFLYEAEASGYPLKIRTTKVKTRTKKDEKLLQVNMDISAFRAVQGGSEG